MRSTDGFHPLRALGGVTALALAAILATSCGDAGNGGGGGPSVADPAAVDRAAERIARVGEAVDRWLAATSLADARAAAEEARNLITGPSTFGAGDLDGDGVTVGAQPGFLPAADGGAGLVSALAGCAAVDEVVLGGSWADAAGRWATLGAVIDRWTPTNNPFPTLPSHPQRIVGWATLTLRSTSSLDDAHEFAGHARLHAKISGDAVQSCA